MLHTGHVEDILEADVRRHMVSHSPLRRMHTLYLFLFYCLHCITTATRDRCVNVMPFDAASNSTLPALMIVTKQKEEVDIMATERCSEVIKYGCGGYHFVQFRCKRKSERSCEADVIIKGVQVGLSLVEPL